MYRMTEVITDKQWKLRTTFRRLLNTAVSKNVFRLSWDTIRGPFAGLTNAHQIKSLLGAGDED